MQILNCCGNQDGSKLQVCWYATAQVVETDNGVGSHLQYHVESDKEMTLNVLYAPAVTSMSQFIEKTNTFLVGTDKKGRE